MKERRSKRREDILSEAETRYYNPQAKLVTSVAVHESNVEEKSAAQRRRLHVNTSRRERMKSGAQSLQEEVARQRAEEDRHRRGVQEEIARRESKLSVQKEIEEIMCSVPSSRPTKELDTRQANMALESEELARQPPGGGGEA